jgi:hypothetical protein
MKMQKSFSNSLEFRPGIDCAPLTIALAAGLLCLGLTGCSKNTDSSTGAALPESKELESPTTAIPVFSSFGVDGSYDTQAGGAVVDDSIEYRLHPERFKPDMRDHVNIEHGYRGQAEWFVPEISGDLNQISIALKRNKTGSGLANVSIAEDKGGIPGTILECFSNVICSATSSQPLIPVTLVSSKHPAISGGKKYWVCAEPSDDRADILWLYNNRHISRGFAYERSPWEWTFVDGGPDNGAFGVSIIRR